MSQPKHEPTEADGPLFRAAYQQAGRLDETPEGQRGPAWARFLRAAVLALAEGLLREAFVWGAYLFSILAVVFGATGGDIAWLAPMVGAGVAGIALVTWALFRKWSFGRQWAVLLAVVVGDIALLVTFWRLH